MFCNIGANFIFRNRLIGSVKQNFDIPALYTKTDHNFRVRMEVETGFVI